MPVTWQHKDFNCKGDNTGKGTLVVPHFHGNSKALTESKKKYHQFTRFSKTLLHYVQSIFACM